MRLAPGGPFEEERSLPPEIWRTCNAPMDSISRVPVQYGRYLRGPVAWRFGPSFRYKDFTVNELIAQGAPVTVELGSIALALALGIGIPLGTIAALHRHSATDYVAVSLAVLGIAIPLFVVLPLLAPHIRSHAALAAGCGGARVAPRYLVLPVIALTLPPLAYIARLTRGGLLETLGQPLHAHGSREGAAASDPHIPPCPATGARSRRGLSGTGGRLHHDGIAGGRVACRACRASGDIWCKGR